MCRVFPGPVVLLWGQGSRPAQKVPFQEEGSKCQGALLMWLLPHGPMARLGWTKSSLQLWVLGPAPVPRDMGLRVSSVQSLSHVRLFTTPWTAAHSASLSITNSGSLPKLLSVESVMPSNHLILCRLLLLPPSIFPSIRVFSNESALSIRWPKCWSFSFSISPSSQYSD